LGYWLKWGLYGIWTGLLIALGVIDIGSIVILARIDWEEQSKQAILRSEKKSTIEMDSLIVSNEEEESASDVNSDQIGEYSPVQESDE
jgi:NAD dependent epimerase/dehydratase family enzyme